MPGPADWFNLFTANKINGEIMQQLVTRLTLKSPRQPVCVPQLRVGASVAVIDRTVLRSRNRSGFMGRGGIVLMISCLAGDTFVYVALGSTEGDDAHREWLLADELKVVS